jgi:hypothetical protein
MALSLKHSFNSPKSDGTDATLVQPSNWNAEHSLTLGTAKLVGRTTSGTGAAEEISVGAGLTLSAGSLTGNVVTVAGRTGAITLAVADVTGAAPLASPTFTGTVSGAAATLTGTLTGVAGAFSGALSGATVADAVGTIRPIVAGTSVATTSGTALDLSITIPSWVKRITIAYNGVSLSGSAHSIIQLGAGSYATTGYVATGAYAGSANQAGVASATNGLMVHGGSATNALTGVMTIVAMGSNLWVASHSGFLNSNIGVMGGGSVTLGGTLDRIRLTTTNGTDTFDAGSVNILYE